MTRVMLAWEAGAGRGHVVTLSRVAQALQGIAGCDAALGWMDHAAEIAPWCDGVFPGVKLPFLREARRARGAPLNATWADYLNDCGFGDAERLRANVAWWLETLALRRIGLVVGDYAPCALIAARIAGIPALAIGTGYGIPPPDLPCFPIFLPRYAAEREVDEAQMTEAINAALGPLGLPKLAALPQIHTRSGEMICSLPLLDPYAGHRAGDAYLPPVADFGGAREGGSEAFCYFSTGELRNEALVEALCTSGLPLRGYLPDASDSVRSRLAASGMLIEDAPVPVADIVRTTRMMINGGQHGILCLGLGAGIPQVCIPHDLEKLYLTSRAQETGAARTVPPRSLANEIVAALREAWDDPEMVVRARCQARELKPNFATDADAGAQAIRNRLRPWLDR